MQQLSRLRSDTADCLVIARCSINDGLGHFFRSLSLFLAARERFTVFFVIVGDFIPQQVKLIGEGFWLHAADDAECAALVEALIPKVVVLDTLTLEFACFSRISQVSFVISISPVFEHLGECDLIVHRSTAFPAEWESFGEKPRILKGKEFTIVSPFVERVELHDYRRNLKRDKFHVGISMGGTDSRNRTLELIRQFNRLPDLFVLWVAVGPGYAHSLDELMSETRSAAQEIIIVSSNESFWSIFRNVSLVVSAGGLSTYEACIAGIPSLTVSEGGFANFLVREIVDIGASVIVGGSNGKHLTVGATCFELFSNRERLERMRSSTSLLPQAEGAWRLTQIIESRLQNGESAE